MEVCSEWEIEVDQNQQECNLKAQENFIISFVGSLYKDVDSGHSSLSKISSLYFAHIFQPLDNKMGTCVRLRVFTEEADLQTIKTEINSRLGKSCKVESLIDWPKDCEQYGGRAISPLFRDYLNSISRICYQLLLIKGKGVNVESTLWPCTHLFFNMICGYGRGVVEFQSEVVTGFIPNV